MSAGATGGRQFAYGIILSLILPLGSHVAQARQPLAYTNVRSFAFSPGVRAFAHHHYGTHHVGHWRHLARGGFHYRHYAGMYRHHGGLQCVAFVREETGVQLRGNAATWWNEADGQYARGHAPEAGAVLSFRGAGRMRLGHVAVVRGVVNSREIDIDHAHWAGSGILRDISVIDVSPDNDWTAVRVALRQGAKYGSVYPTYGFIYDRSPDTRVQTAAASGSAPQARMQTASAFTGSDALTNRAQTASAISGPDAVISEDPPAGEVVRTHRRRHWHRWVARRRVYAEVAELPMRHRLDLALPNTIR
jgi:surface antigen